MADDPIAESDTAEDHAADDDGLALDEVHERALRRFDSVALPQVELRAQSLEDRRFVTIPGAMWESSWSQNWADNAPRPEVDKISKAIRKIESDYRQNRMMVDYRPADDKADEDTAAFLDGVYRADDYHYKGRQARDNAFLEAIQGGFGAYRQSTDWADPYDKDSDDQRVIPAILIGDADQCVYFDPASKLYDKSDAKWAFVIHVDPRETAEEKWGEDNIDPWPIEGWRWGWDWYRVDSVQTAEYYEVEEREEKLLIFTNELTEEEQRYFASELDADEIKDLKAQGWKQRSRSIKRRRVRKFILNGTKVLKDCGPIAGDQIPIVPVYGNRAFVDGMERWWGHVRKRVDEQRIFNSMLGSMVELDSLAPREIPIFAAEQMPPNLAALWANQNIERHPYALVEPLRNEDGSIASAGAIGKVEPPQVPPVKAALVQMLMSSLADDDDNADQVKANVSADAMDIAAQRVDDKSGLYLDNMNQSVQREGEIYLSMAREVYVEPDRKVETLDMDGNSDMATLMQPTLGPDKVFKTRNDLTIGRYKVVSTVQEATATKRDKAVRQSLAVAEVAIQAQAMDIASAALLNAVENQDGEGMQKLQDFAHKKAVSIGLDEPTDAEKAEMEKAQQNQQPDPAAQALMATAQKEQSAAQLNMAKVDESKASALLKMAQAQAVGGPESAPEAPSGLDAPHPVEQIEKLASADLKTAQAAHLRHDMQHKDNQSGIAAHKAETDRQKIRMGNGRVAGQ